MNIDTEIENKDDSFLIECKRCRYRTKNKGDLKKHLAKKYVCPPLFSSLPRNQLIECMHEIKTNGETPVSSLSGAEEVERLRNELVFAYQNVIPKLIKLSNDKYFYQDENMPLFQFGKEDVSYLTTGWIKKQVKAGVYGAIPKIVREIYLTKKHPENMNVKITNEKSKYAKIFNGSTFIKYPKNTLLKDLVTKYIHLIEEIYEEDKEKPLAYTRFEENYSKNDKEVMRILCKRVECEFLNA